MRNIYLLKKIAVSRRYSEDKVSCVKTHWLWGVNEDVWTCSEYEQELLKKQIAEQDFFIQEAKEKGIEGEE